ncbi:hypothetical protein ACQU0X_26000 [Pseudovibrio ascidiaceicola]
MSGPMSGMVTEQRAAAAKIYSSMNDRNGLNRPVAFTRDSQL